MYGLIGFVIFVFYEELSLNTIYIRILCISSAQGRRVNFLFAGGGGLKIINHFDYYK